MSQFCRSFVVALLLLFPWTTMAFGESLTVARLTFPSEGTAFDTSLPFSWTPVDGAQAYYLYVGTTIGANDLVDSREIHQTTYLVTNLPGNQTAFARLWTKAGGVWFYTDRQFTTAPVSRLTSPAPASSDVGPTTTFTWRPTSGAEAYYLYVGTAPGSKDLVDTREIQQTSHQSAPLPPRQTVYARLWTKWNGVWRFADSPFTTAAIASLTSPTAGSGNVAANQTFTWQPVPDAQAYYLYVGTSVGARDVVDSRETQLTQYDASLPGGLTLYARLWTKAGNVWRFADSQFSTAPVAILLSPASGTANAGPTQEFTWTTVTGAQAYYLFVGTSAGAHDIVDSHEIQRTSYQPAPLPGGRTLYVRLWTKVSDVWRYVDSVFSVPVLTATLTSPADGASDVNPLQPLQWTSVAGAQAYVLWVGSSAGAKNLLSTPETQQTSFVATGLPPNQNLYARLWTQVGGIWRFVDSTFTVAPVTATLTYPPNGATNVDLTQPIRWTSVPNAQAHVLWLGSSPGARDLVGSPESAQTSYFARGLPAGRVIYARLWTKVAGLWRYVDSTFDAAAVAATLIFPADGAIRVDSSVPATWGEVAAGEAYVLWVGSTPGGKDLLRTLEGQQTSASIVSLPPNRLLHATLWTKTGGEWRHTDSTFSVASIAPEFEFPLNGSTGVDATQPFRWMAPVGGADMYNLRIGTAPGADDVLNTGEIQTTSYLVSGLPQTGPLYARIWAKANGHWDRHSDIVFTLDANVEPSTIEEPADGMTDFDSGYPFEWSEVPLAAAYRLSIGTTPGGSDLHQSGEIHITRRFVRGLPANITLFGRLETKIDGAWYETDFTFSVNGSGHGWPGRRRRFESLSNQIDSALWATHLVRSMADTDNRPFQWTTLHALISPRYGADCAEYSAALLAVLRELNIDMRSRRLDIAFNTDGFLGHTLVEMQIPVTRKWMLLDPTFDLTVKRADGFFATAADVSQATAAFDWSAISYEFLGDEGDFYVRNYYIDYPLLYLTVQNAFRPILQDEEHAPLQFLQFVTTPVAEAAQLYLARCVGSTSVQVTINGTTQDLPCYGIDQLSRLISAASVGSQNGDVAPALLYALRRFVF